MSLVDQNDNPLLRSSGLPPFDRIHPEHVVPAVRAVLARAEEQLGELERSCTADWDVLFGQLDEIDRPFDYAWDPVSHLFGVMNTPELREAYEAVLDEVVQFGLRVSQSQVIFDVCHQIRKSDQWSQLSRSRQRIVEKRIQSAELSGIALRDEARERFNAIVQELSQLSTKFSNHVLDATRAWDLILTDTTAVEGMPPTALAMAAQSFNQQQQKQNQTEASLATAETGPWRFTLDIPSITPFLQHCRRSDLREQAYRAFVTRASAGEFDNLPLINRILKLRHEKAQLLGFTSFADLSLATKMAPDVPAVLALLEQLRSAAWQPAVAEMSELKSFAAGQGCRDELKHWDLSFWAERLRENRFDYTDEELRPYFPQERVLAGMFALARELFGIDVRSKDGVPVWHRDVRYFEVFDDAGTLRAAFYLDPYSRPETKRPGAWMDSCFGRRVVNGTVRIPVAHLVCNSTPPVGETPSLMTFREVETLFHEFGHGLQHMLTIVDESAAAGINGIEWDAVELPSQFMENWCYHKPVMSQISGHYQTGEPLPDELFEKLCAARTFRAGSLMLRQLSFGMTDLALHSELKPTDIECNPTAVLELQRRIMERTSVMPMLPEDRSLCTFSHIFSGGYAAGYYSYKWAEVLSADAFGAFEEAGLDNPAAIAATGRRFRDTVLALGGSQDPMVIFRVFRGREPDPQALLRHSGLLPASVQTASL